MNYIADTCDRFNVVFTLDTPNLFASPITGLTTVATIDYLLMSQIPTPAAFIVSATGIKSLVLTPGNYETTYVCIPTIIPSVAAN